MKKFFFLATVAIAAIASAFVSCESDDDNTLDSSKEAVVTLSYQVSDDLLAFADVSFTITDFVGKTETLKVTNSTSGTKEFSTTSRQGEGKVGLNITPKNDFKAQAGRDYDLSIMCNLAIGIRSTTGSYSQLISNNDLLSGATYISNVCELSADEVLNSMKKRYSISNEVVCTLKDGAFVQ